VPSPILGVKAPETRTIRVPGFCWAVSLSNGGCSTKIGIITIHAAYCRMGQQSSFNPIHITFSVFSVVGVINVHIKIKKA